jgi:hypothetical protein
LRNNISTQVLNPDFVRKDHFRIIRSQIIGVEKIIIDLIYRGFSFSLDLKVDIPYCIYLLKNFDDIIFNNLWATNKSFNHLSSATVTRSDQQVNFTNEKKYKLIIEKILI